MQNIKKNTFLSTFVLTFCLLFGISSNLKSAVTLPTEISAFLTTDAAKLSDAKRTEASILMRRNFLDISILMLKSPDYKNAIFASVPGINKTLDAQRKTTFSNLIPAINKFLTTYYNGNFNTYH